MAQSWPQPDALAHAGTFGVDFGSYLGGYLGVRFDTGTTWGTGKIMTRAADALAGAPDALCIGSAAFEGKRHGFVRREEIAEVGGSNAYLRVEATCYVRMVAPPVLTKACNVLKGGCGVTARVTGGTLVEPGAGVYDPVVYLDQPSGYAAYAVGDPATGVVTIVLERWVAGARTQLATLPLHPIIPSFLVPFILRLELQNTATQVTLTVSLKNVAAEEGLFGLTGAVRVGVPTWSSVNLANAFTVALTYVDTSVSRRASPGRAGFILDKENRVTAASVQIDTAAHCLAFEAATTGAIRLRDEWKRSVRLGRDETSRWSDAGQNAAADWGFDRFSELFRDCQQLPYTGPPTYTPANGVQGYPVVKRATGTFGITLTQPQSKPAQEQLCLLARELPAANRAKHALTFKHPTVGAGEAGVVVGLVLRATQAGADGFDGTYRDAFSGYSFEIDGNGRCAIRRRQSAANPLNTNPFDDTAELASLTIAHSATARLLEVECVDDSTPDLPGAGPVLLRMWVDSVQVAFTSSALAGVSVAADGTVRDAGDGRIAGARGVALIAAFPATGVGVSHVIEVHATEELEPSDDEIPDDELASVVLSDETSTVDGTLDWTPSWALPCEPARDVIEDRYVTGNAARRPAVTTVRQVWDIGRRAASDDELRELEAFYDDHGSEVPFHYTVPGEAAGVYRFAGAIEAEQTDADNWTVRFRLEQLHDA